jgi:hypothetical protein
LTGIDVFLDAKEVQETIEGRGKREEGRGKRMEYIFSYFKS